MVEPYLALWFWRHPWVVSVSVGCNVGELCVLGLRGPGKLNAQDRSHAVGLSWHALSVFPLLEERKSFCLDTENGARYSTCTALKGPQIPLDVEYPQKSPQSQACPP